MLGPDSQQQQWCVVALYVNSVVFPLSLPRWVSLDKLFMYLVDVSRGNGYEGEGEVKTCSSWHCLDIWVYIPEFITGLIFFYRLMYFYILSDRGIDMGYYQGKAI